ncbi:MAG: 2-hydroxyacid dehydrogenase [Rhodobacter sp.]|nr:2-hydroxyacid dehydrogenase [Rhodobacter sp.]
MSKPHMLLIGNASARSLERLDAVFTVHRMPEDRDAFLAQHGGDIEYVMASGGGGVPGALMEKLPGLKIVSNYGVGYDSVDVATAVRRKVVVSHTPNVLNDEVANTAIMLLLTTARNFVHDNQYLRSGRWAKDGDAPLSRGIAGCRVGILGLGRIGLATAEKLAVFGVDVVYHGRSKRDVPYHYYDDLTDMARDVDILISIAPGGASTLKIINREVMDALGPEGILINVGRGSVVDEDALIAALQDGRLGKAGLDVFANEPNVPQALIDLPNATLLPHVGSATVETRQAMGDLAVENLTAFHATGKAVTPVPECREM